MTQTVLAAAGEVTTGEQVTFWILAPLALIGALGLVLLLSVLVPEKQKEEVDASKPAYPDSFPLPPLDLRVPPSPRLKVTAGEKTPVTVPAAAPDSPATGEE